MANIIGNRIKEAINLRGFKQADIVKNTGINKGALSSYIKGNYLPKQVNLYKIAKALNVNPTWLMGYNVPMDADYIPDKIIANEEDYAIIDKNIGKFKKGQIVQVKEITNYLNELVDTVNKKKEQLFSLYKENIIVLNSLLKENKITKEKYILECKKNINRLFEAKVITKKEYNEMIKNIKID